MAPGGVGAAVFGEAKTHVELACNKEGPTMGGPAEGTEVSREPLGMNPKHLPRWHGVKAIADIGTC